MDVKLDILNAMLAAIGSSGITSTVGRHPGLIKSTPILERVNRSIQGRGHWFNTDWGLKLAPSAEKEFILPQNTLKADTTNKRDPYVRRGRRMYDPKNHTYAIDIESMKIDVVIQLDYDDLPQSAIDLIRCESIWQLVCNDDLDSISLQTRQRDLTEAKQTFATEKLAQSDTSIRNNPDYIRIMGGLNQRYTSRNPIRIGG